MTVLALTFHRPGWLLLLFAVAVLAAGYVALQLRRRTYVVRFTNLDLLDKVAPAQPGWRRHVPATAYLAAMVALVLAVAGPFHQHKVPHDRATVMLAIDTSLSMEATDMDPDRITAAKTSATSFLATVPPGVHVGLVSFNGRATLRVPPTLDRQRVRDAIGNLQLGESTAIGDAIEVSLDALQSLPPAADGKPVPASIVLLSDGTTTVGTPNEVAVARAKQEGVPVSTIAFGKLGTTITVGGQLADVSVDRGALADIANSTGGKAFVAENTGQARNVYQEIARSVGYIKEPSDLTVWFVGAGVLLLLGAGVASLAWFSRLP